MMERLTTDKFTKDMRMYELAHNSCYVGENGAARYRDFDKDVEARDYIRKLMLKYGTWKEDDAEMTDDDSFGESMIDLLFYGEESIEGIIALLYLHMWSKADLHGRLKEYEDTNLTPEQIHQIDKDFSVQAKELGEYKKLEEQTGIDAHKLYGCLMDYIANQKNVNPNDTAFTLLTNEEKEEMGNLIERMAEEIENLYGRETELTEKSKRLYR